MSAPGGPGRCPICGEPRDRRFRPFCSARCKDVDLNRWLKGAYGIPVVEHDDIVEDEPADPSHRH